MRAELPMACKKKTKTKIMLNWKKVTKRRSGMTMKAEKKEKTTVEKETEQMNTKVVRFEPREGACPSFMQQRRYEATLAVRQKTEKELQVYLNYHTRSGPHRSLANSRTATS
jgi:hypothetical protein